MATKLTATQTTVIKSAAARPDGNIEPLPANLRGGARTAVIGGLLARDLITKLQHPDHVEYYLTDAAYAAVGHKRKPPAPVMPDPVIEAAVTAVEAQWVQEKQAATKPRSRENSKQATVIQMLQRPDGTTVQQVMAATGWQSHTVRGTFAGALKKKLGLSIVSEKVTGGERTYRIAVHSAAKGVSSIPSLRHRSSATVADFDFSRPKPPEMPTSIDFDSSAVFCGSVFATPRKG